MSVFTQLHKWSEAMLTCENQAVVLECRLTHDQAMRLCFEVGTQPISARYPRGPASKALWAYACGRPWDYLKGARFYGTRLVPCLREYARKSRV